MLRRRVSECLRGKKPLQVLLLTAKTQIYKAKQQQTQTDTNFVKQ